MKTFGLVLFKLLLTILAVAGLVVIWILVFVHFPDFKESLCFKVWEIVWYVSLACLIFVGVGTLLTKIWLISFDGVEKEGE